LGEELLLLRPIPINPAKVNIKKMPFSQLPISAKKEISKQFSPYRGKYTSEECYIIDINSDASPDIVKATLTVITNGYNSVLVRYNSTWTVRYNNAWTWE
jgi:hypothetical protein